MSISRYGYIYSTDYAVATEARDYARDHPNVEPDDECYKPPKPRDRLPSKASSRPETRQNANLTDSPQTATTVVEK